LPRLVQAHGHDEHADDRGKTTGIIPRRGWRPSLSGISSRTRGRFRDRRSATPLLSL